MISMPLQVLRAWLLIAAPVHCTLPTTVRYTRLCASRTARLSTLVWSSPKRAIREDMLTQQLRTPSVPILSAGLLSSTTSLARVITCLRCPPEHSKALTRVPLTLCRLLTWLPLQSAATKLTASISCRAWDFAITMPPTLRLTMSLRASTTSSTANTTTVVVALTTATPRPTAEPWAPALWKPPISAPPLPGAVVKDLVRGSCQIWRRACFLDTTQRRIPALRPLIPGSSLPPWSMAEVEISGISVAATHKRVVSRPSIAVFVLAHLAATPITQCISREVFSWVPAVTTETARPAPSMRV